MTTKFTNRSAPVLGQHGYALILEVRGVTAVLEMFRTKRDLLRAGADWVSSWRRGAHAPVGRHPNQTVKGSYFGHQGDPDQRFHTLYSLKRNNELYGRLYWSADGGEGVLDAATVALTAFPSFAAMLNAGGGYRPTMMLCDGTTLEDRRYRALADAYDAAQAARGDARRVYRGERAR